MVSTELENVERIILSSLYFLYDNIPISLVEEKDSKAIFLTGVMLMGSICYRTRAIIPEQKSHEFSTILSSELKKSVHLGNKLSFKNFVTVEVVDITICSRMCTDDIRNSMIIVNSLMSNHAQNGSITLIQS